MTVLSRECSGNIRRVRASQVGLRRGVRIFLASWLGWMVTIAVLPATAAGRVPQDAEWLGTSEWNRGYHGLKVVAEGSGFEFSTLERWQSLPASQRVLIILGDLRSLPVDLEEVRRAGVPILIASDGSDAGALKWLGVTTHPNNASARFERDRYNNLPDCPRVRPGLGRIGKQHPLFDDVRSVVTNRPSYFVPTPGCEARFRLWLPRMQPASLQLRPLLLTLDSPGRVVGISDASIFTNQMLLVENNLSLAENTCRWLMDGQSSRQLLMIVDGQVESAVDPSAIGLVPPPPTREEVLNALRNLPPEAMLEFGNSVAQIAEDDNMINEFLSGLSRDFSQRSVNRFLILLGFSLACLLGLATYFWQKKLLRKTASDVAHQRQRLFAKRHQSRLAEERRTAASALINRFCLETANRRLEDWPMFPQGLELGNDPLSQAVIRDMTDANQLLRTAPATKWTEMKLLELESSIADWTQFWRRHQARTESGTEHPV